MKYYSLKNILKRNAIYNLVIGKRSNGKTYASLEYALKRFLEYEEETVYLRRWEEDTRGKLGGQFLGGLVDSNLINEMSDGKYDNYVYKNKKIYLAKYDKDLDKLIESNKIFIHVLSLSNAERLKGQQFPLVKTIIFDEFLTDLRNITNELSLFQSVISTITRRREDVKVFLLANTVQTDSIYFDLFEIDDIMSMAKGEIRDYYINNTKIAVEYTEDDSKINVLKNLYLPFSSSYANMANSGDWEIDEYPALPILYNDLDVFFSFYILAKKTLKADIVLTDESDYFMYIYELDYDIDFTDEDVVFSDIQSHKKLRYINLRRSIDKVTSLINSIFDKHKVFYENKIVGDYVENYINKTAFK